LTGYLVKVDNPSANGVSMHTKLNSTVRYYYK